MLLNRFGRKILSSILDKFVLWYFHKFRIKLYNILSSNSNISGKPLIIQPLLLKGNGRISFGENVQVGYSPSPFLYNGYTYLEARSSSSKIAIGDNVFLNNNLVIICDRTSIIIGNNVLIGFNVEIIDSDFHNVEPKKRMTDDYICRCVTIEENVFIGSNSRIMKGVVIGRNSVVANSSIVVKSVPENVIVAGNPAKIIKTI